MSKATIKVPEPACKRALAPLADKPAELFKLLAEKLGGPAGLAKFLNCSRASAYNLLVGRQRWSSPFLQKALEVLNEGRVVLVNSVWKAGFKMYVSDWRPRKPKMLPLTCDGAFQVQGHAMWPLVADGQYVLYRDVHSPDELHDGDIVLAHLRGGDAVIKAWHASEKKKGQVFLVSLFRDSKVFRKELLTPYSMNDFTRLRRVVGVWMG